MGLFRFFERNSRGNSSDVQKKPGKAIDVGRPITRTTEDTPRANEKPIQLRERIVLPEFPDEKENQTEVKVIEVGSFQHILLLVRETWTKEFKPKLEKIIASPNRLDGVRSWLQNIRAKRLAAALQADESEVEIAVSQAQETPNFDDGEDFVLKTYEFGDNRPNQQELVEDVVDEISFFDQLVETYDERIQAKLNANGSLSLTDTEKLRQLRAELGAIDGKYGDLVREALQITDDVENISPEALIKRDAGQLNDFLDGSQVILSELFDLITNAISPNVDDAIPQAPQPAWQEETWQSQPTEEVVISQAPDFSVRTEPVNRIPNEREAALETFNQLAEEVARIHNETGLILFDEGIDDRTNTDFTRNWRVIGNELNALNRMVNTISTRERDVVYERKMRSYTSQINGLLERSRTLAIQVEEQQEKILQSRKNGQYSTESARLINDFDRRYPEVRESINRQIAEIQQSLLDEDLSRADRLAKQKQLKGLKRLLGKLTWQRGAVTTYVRQLLKLDSYVSGDPLDAQAIRNSPASATEKSDFLDLLWGLMTDKLAVVAATQSALAKEADGSQIPSRKTERALMVVETPPKALIIFGENVYDEFESHGRVGRLEGIIKRVSLAAEQVRKSRFFRSWRRTAASLVLTATLVSFGAGLMQNAFEGAASSDDHSAEIAPSAQEDSSSDVNEQASADGESVDLEIAPSPDVAPVIEAENAEIAPSAQEDSSSDVNQQASTDGESVDSEISDVAPVIEAESVESEQPVVVEPEIAANLSPVEEWNQSADIGQAVALETDTTGLSPEIRRADAVIEANPSSAANLVNYLNKLPNSNPLTPEETEQAIEVYLSGNLSSDVQQLADAMMYGVTPLDKDGQQRGFYWSEIQAVRDALLNPGNASAGQQG